MELIKCNDAMWGDLAVCGLIKKPPPTPITGMRRRREREKDNEKKECDRERKTEMKGQKMSLRK